MVQQRAAHAENLAGQPDQPPRPGCGSALLDELRLKLWLADCPDERAALMRKIKRVEAGNG